MLIQKQPGLKEPWVALTRTCNAEKNIRYDSGASSLVQDYHWQQNSADYSVCPRIELFRRRGRGGSIRGRRRAELKNRPSYDDQWLE